MHPWVGAGPEDRRHILAELGLDSIDELFASIPSSVCVDGVDLPPARDEDWIRRALGDLARLGGNFALAVCATSGRLLGSWS